MLTSNRNGESSKIKKRIFIGLLAASVLLILGIILSGIFIYYNKFGAWHRYLLLALIAILGLFVLTVSIGLAGVVMTLLNVKKFYGLEGLMNASLNLMFPLVLALGKLLHIPKDVIKSSYIEVNNKLIQSRCFNFKPADILILAPHCLQKWDCPYKITSDASNCRHCGRCDIDKLLKISNDYGVNLSVVTGGTLARKKVMDIKPKAIIAIACERDLTEGILDTNPLPVMGVINLRPEGPCKNTLVDLDKVTEAIDFFTNRKEHSRFEKS